MANGVESVFPDKRKLALIMASATPAAYFRGQNVQVSENMAFKDFSRHPKWPKVADAVIEARKLLFIGKKQILYSPIQIPRLKRTTEYDIMQERRSILVSASRKEGGVKHDGERTQTY